jgi:ElaA protein
MSLLKQSIPFSSLSPFQVYDILRLRSEVFVVEQNCVFLDMDNKDQHCEQILITSNTLIGTARIVPPGIAYDEVSIGRIVTHPSVRGTGVGKILVDYSIQRTEEMFGRSPIKIGAQLYARKFYESFGFVQVSDVYDEDGIDHIHMIRG